MFGHLKRKSPKKISPLKQKNILKPRKTTTVKAYASFDTIEPEYFLLSICSNLESRTVTINTSYSSEDLQSLVLELKSTNERLLQAIRSVTTLQDKLKSEVAELNGRNAMLQARIFSVDRFLESDKDVTFYTEFPSRGVFESVFEFLDPGNEGENIKYWHSQ